MNWEKITRSWDKKYVIVGLLIAALDVNMTFTSVTPIHMEIQDAKGDTIHRIRGESSTVEYYLFPLINLELAYPDCLTELRLC